ncbi:MAG: hypothetical protein LAP86_19535 [Acidobacteriia bacterium]|nr:hypothetical protein [Terriglobia bacterium]
MSTERLQEPEVVADFHVKLQSDVEPPMGEPGKSLAKEVELLRLQVAQLCQATRGLVTLISVLDKKVDVALKGGPGADFAVLG